MSNTETTYRAEAWRDPVSGFVNVALVRVVVENRDSMPTVEVADSWDCTTRRPEYHEPDTFDDEITPTVPSAALATNEAVALRDALDAVLGDRLTD